MRALRETGRPVEYPELAAKGNVFGRANSRKLLAGALVHFLDAALRTS